MNNKIICNWIDENNNQCRSFKMDNKSYCNFHQYLNECIKKGDRMMEDMKYIIILCKADNDGYRCINEVNPEYGNLYCHEHSKLWK